MLCEMQRTQDPACGVHHNATLFAHYCVHYLKISLWELFLIIADIYLIATDPPDDNNTNVWLI